jgi:hypothetical protein
MRIQDLFARIRENVNNDSENITAQSTAELNITQTNSQPQETKIGIAGSSDQFERFKPNPLDQMMAMSPQHLLESSLVSNKAAEIPMDESFRRNTPASELIPNTYDSTSTVRSEIWRANLTDNDLIPSPSPTENFRYNLEYHLKNLANDPNRFNDELTKIYGDNYDVGKAESLRQRVIAGDFSWLPKIEAKSDSTLDGKFAAFDPSTNVIYVNDSKRQPILGSFASPLEELTYRNAYNKAIWTAMRRELDPADADNTQNRYLGTISIDGQPRNIEWIVLQDLFGGFGKKTGQGASEDSALSIAALQKRWR